MTSPSPWLALALVALTTPALAQTTTSTRAEELRQIREQKAAAPPQTTTARVERFLNWIETGPLSQNAVRDGFGVRVGGIENGAGLAFGPAWRASNIAGGTVHLEVSGAYSVVGDHEASVVMTAPRLAGDRLAAGVSIDRTHLAQERFFGRGMATAPGGITAFALDRRSVALDASLRATNWLRVSGSAGTLATTSLDAQGPGIPAISTRFTTTDASGLGLARTFAVTSLSATADFRDVPQNPRRGGRYHIAASNYAAGRQQLNSFARVDAEVEQHFSAWKRQRVLTLRAFASTTMTPDGHEVPFYLQPALGGSRLLRGFATDRFRDRSLLALQAEYGWDLTPFVNAVLFYEAGAVGPRLRDITVNGFRRDYGIGFRFGSARTVAFRTDVAFGSGEGTRLTMRFNHAF